MKKIIFYSLFIIIITISKVTPSLDFANRNVSIVLNENNSSLKLTNLAGLKGWSEMSIVRASGNNNSWASNLYTSAPSHLIYSNSNAIIGGGLGAPASLTDLVRNNSNSIVSMETEITTTYDYLYEQIKNNSNAIIPVDTRITTNASNIATNASNISTNAGNILTNANDIATNLTQIRGNSSYSNVLSKFIVDNSNAISGGEFGIPVSLSQAVINNSNRISNLDIKLTNTYNDLSAQIENNSNAIVSGIGGAPASLTDLVRNNSNKIISLDTSLTINTNNISTNVSNISTNAGSISTNGNNISTNATNISTNAGNILTNANDISTNQTYISGNSSYSHYLQEFISSNSNAIFTIADPNNPESIQTQIFNNSNSIINLNTKLTDTYQYLSNEITTTYNYLYQQIKNNSNSIIKDFQIKSVHEQYITANSTTILNLKDAIISNSEAVHANSQTILNLIPYITTNSTAILDLDDRVLANSDWSYTNSVAIGLLDPSANYNAALIFQTSELARANSDAIASGGIGGGSAAASQLAINNSNLLASITDANNPNSISYVADHFVSISDGVWYAAGAITGETYLFGRGSLSSPIDLQGATLTLGGDLMLSSDSSLLSSGFFNPAGHAIILGGDLIIPSGITLTFSGDGIMDGQGNNLIFQGDGKIKLDPYVTVTLRNITLQEVKDCAPSNSSICMSTIKPQLVLQNAQINLDRNYTFSLGELYIHGDVQISGTNQFNYTSTNAALIDKHSTLLFDMNTTFSYGPLSDNKNLIKMTDETSMLFLNGAALIATTTGLQLTKGTMVLDHKNYLYNQDYFGKPATNISQAIVFGNGNGDDDLRIQVLPGGSLDLKTGILDYQNSN